jgi:hypothetical protein
MSHRERWIVKCQDTADGNADVVVDLPQEVLEKFGLGIGDVLTIEVVGGAIVLKPMCDTSPTPSSIPSST